MDTIDLQLSELSDWDRKAMEALAAVVPEVEDAAATLRREKEAAAAKVLARDVEALLAVQVPAAAVQDGVLAVGGYRFALVRGRIWNAYKEGWDWEGATPRLLARCSRSGRLAVSPSLTSRDVLAEQLHCFKAECDNWGRGTGSCPAESGLGRWYWRRRGWGGGQVCGAAYTTLPGEWKQGNWAIAWIVIGAIVVALLGTVLNLMHVDAGTSLALVGAVGLGPFPIALLFWLATLRPTGFKG